MRPNREQTTSPYATKLEEEKGSKFVMSCEHREHDAKTFTCLPLQDCEQNTKVKTKSFSKLMSAIDERTQKRNQTQYL